MTNERLLNTYFFYIYLFKCAIKYLKEKNEKKNEKINAKRAISYEKERKQNDLIIYVVFFFCLFLLTFYSFASLIDLSNALTA